MISKNELKGKYITYLWNGSYRTHKVIKITGNTLTVKDAVGTKHRIHPKTNKIFGRQYPKRGLEKIKW